MTKTIAIIGSNGFVGKVMSQKTQEKGFDCIQVTRDNYHLAVGNEMIDCVINCAMPSGRFWAKNNSTADFQETVEKTHQIKTDFQGAKLIQISSISARLQRDTVYGRNKLAAEGLLNPKADLIIRLGPLYHPSMTKGALIDIIKNENVFVSGETKYAFTPLDWACEHILANLSSCGILEVGSKGYVTLGVLASEIGSKSMFEGEIDDQVFLEGGSDRPDATKIFDFARARVGL
ncbi:MAG: hypothetical protein P8I13_03370 [Porticoccaceae bacterium]|nr:hypothetical protein [Porticoccaceae bacterium]